ncbi:hypothetical protein HDU85_006137 [Gaertneriomyces sp. JEL0708]|nr:hypothetical protein HDU85_006137 [Gaertneriomyces sp. JEL0708]
MGDAGFFKGTSADQDARFANKQKKLLKTMKFPKVYDQKVDIKKVNLTVIRPWVTARLTELLGFEDDVLVELIFNLLEAEKLDPRLMQIEISGFLEANSPHFMEELWSLLASAQNTVGGIPQIFLDQKKEEILKKRKENEQISAQVRNVKDKEAAERAERSSSSRVAPVGSEPDRRLEERRDRRRASSSRSPGRYPSRRYPSRSPDRYRSRQRDRDNERDVDRRYRGRSRSWDARDDYGRDRSRERDYQRRDERRYSRDDVRQHKSDRYDDRPSRHPQDSSRDRSLRKPESRRTDHRDDRHREKPKHRRERSVSTDSYSDTDSDTGSETSRTSSSSGVSD